MKYAVLFCVLAQLLFAYSKSIPDYISVCGINEPEYAKCIAVNIENQREIIVKGIPELGLPPIDPFKLPAMSVDQDISKIVRIKAVMTEIEVTGLSNAILNDLKLNPHNMTGEIRLTIPWSYLKMNYDVLGQLLLIPLKSKGYFKGNFSDINMHIKASAKTVDKDGVKYFRVDDLKSDIRVGGGNVNLISKNPQLQFTADIINKFFNENPRRTMDAINPIFVETSNDLFRVILDQMLGSVPASEWLPGKF